MGGSDQWGNIVNGVELVRRIRRARSFGPDDALITLASGAKMGKTAAGAVWLNADQLSPYDYWQFWRNTDDADVGRFLRLFTELPVTRSRGWRRCRAPKSTRPRGAGQRRHHAAAWPGGFRHGRGRFEAAFEQGVTSADLPTVEIARASLEAGVPLPALVTEAGLAPSRSEARRLAQGGGVRLNDAPETDVNRLITPADLSPEGVIKLAVGKKKIVLIKPV
jgi:tyrosyl-tRNA synthetase